MYNPQNDWIEIIRETACKNMILCGFSERQSEKAYELYKDCQFKTNIFPYDSSYFALELTWLDPVQNKRKYMGPIF